MQKKYILLLLLCTPAISSCTDEYGHLTSFGVSCLIGVVGALVFVIWVLAMWYKSKREKEKAIEDALKERKDFTESKVLKGKGGNSYYLATDDIRKKVFYVYGDKKLIFDYKDVVAVDVIQNGEILVSKKSAARALGGAILGGAVIGNDTGAILGAMAFGSSSSHSQISKLYVHVLLRNQSLPSLDFMCYNSFGQTIPQMNYNLEYKEASDRAQELYDLFRLIIDEADSIKREEEKQIDAKKKAEEKQVADAMDKLTAAQELMNVSELYLKGLLTDEEYAKMKEKIIGKD